ncbi:MAG: NAD-dependent epimerase/dehydratase family protein, partial [Actinobacteria bacterium]|nr:NAD-dependent epimerase/dehydratase family protein [Actinomycetota bacterium]
MRRALVTGATGFIGSHVAMHLRDRGFEVRGLVRPGGTPGGALPDGIEPAHADVRDLDAVRRAADGTDAIFHAAAIHTLSRRRAAEVHAVNVGGTQVMIDTALAAGIPMVHTSSVATIGIPGDGTHGDEETLQPSAQVIGAYRRSKVEAESLVRRAVARGLEGYVVNPSAPIGPGDHRPTPTGHLIVDALAGRIAAYVDTGLNIVDVRDVAAGHLLALERGVPGRRYILGNAWGNMTLGEILAMVHRAGGPPPPGRRIPHAVAIAAAALDELV